MYLIQTRMLLSDIYVARRIPSSVIQNKKVTADIRVGVDFRMNVGSLSSYCCLIFGCFKKDSLASYPRWPHPRSRRGRCQREPCFVVLAVNPFCVFPMEHYRCCCIIHKLVLVNRGLQHFDRKIEETLSTHQSRDNN